MIDTIIFDLDGLLINSEIVSFQMFKSIVPNFTKIEYTNNYSGHTEKDNINKLKSDYNIKLSYEEIKEMCVRTEKEFIDKGIDLKKGARELLKYLDESGFNIGLATSSTKERAIKILGAHDVLHFFDSFTFGTEVENSKPAPDIFLKSAQKMNASSENCLIFEDSEAGILAAHAAGIKVICVPDMKIPSESTLKLATEVFSSLTEGINYLKEIYKS